MIDISPTLAFLVIGSDGQVGSSLVELLASRAIPYYPLSSEAAFNHEQLTAFLQQHGDVRFIVNTLFEEPAEGLETDYAQWHAVAGTLAEHAHGHDQILLQLSSAMVYSGNTSRAYKESDLPDATSDFGRAMQQIESATAEINPKTISLRVGWLFSDQVGNFLTYLVGAAISQETLSFSGKLRGCPTDSQAVAKVILAMAEQLDCGVDEPPLWGIYHYVDSDACSMHTFAKTVITVVKSMTEVRVETIGEGDSPEMIDAVLEPENYELNCKKILSTFGIKQRPWRRSVHEVLKKKFSSH
ncbi:SDR family oxidoreductase [Reinekea marinisedimentorum]|uniref:dTDP-4-dehydrorhamnose reductase n=1 Tax=Reinekea marinisedimentorum TaxID=230495 RepID=A0A4R3I177_9GAMM|nr:sugar nucleotide-binding protein [Reinekea marinisedimentorum]TCS37599.1 dTDP-4-dehydrorhamnose reductase [Reinekea marinisedimentorum]